MKRLAEIFDFDKQKTWWYRDLALTTIAAVMAMWVVIAVMGPESSFNWRLAVGSGAIAMLCLALTPNRLMLLGAVVGILAIQSWFAVLFSRNHRGLWVAVPTTLLILGLLLRYRKKPLNKG